MSHRLQATEKKWAAEALYSTSNDHGPLVISKLYRKWSLGALFLESPEKYSRP